MIRAIAESVDSDTLSATTCVWWVLSSFTISSIAPTLFGRNTENCFTSGPSNFETVCGRLAGMWISGTPPNLRGRAGQLSHPRCFVGKRNIDEDDLSGLTVYVLML